MKIESKSSISIVKIICVSLILLALSGAGVIAMTTQINTVKITLASGYELTVLTSKTNVAEILEENNIVIEENERVTPSLEEKITELRLNAKSYNLILINYEGLNSLKEVLLEVIDNRTMLVFDEIQGMIKDITDYEKSYCRYLYQTEEEKRELLPNHMVYDSKQMAKMTHVEFFRFPVWEKNLEKLTQEYKDNDCISKVLNPVLFDYSTRNCITNACRYVVINS